MKLILAFAILIIIYSAQERLYKHLWNKNLDVDISFREPYINQGDKSELIEVINNAKWLPLPVLHVKFAAARSFAFSDIENASVTDMYHRNDAFSLLGNQKVTRQLEFTAGKRGYYTIPSLNVTARDFFMSRSYAGVYKNTAGIYVFPNKLSNPGLENVFSEILGEIETRQNRLQDPYTFKGIRDYMYMDSMRQINWKASARTDSLMVNTYNSTVSEKIKIMLNLEPNAMLKTEYIQEKCIELASTAARFFLEQKLPVMLKTNGIDMLTEECSGAEYGASPDHLVTVDKCLARVKENAGLEVFFELLEREIMEDDASVTYIIISSYCKSDLLLKLDYINEKNGRVYVFAPHYDIEKFSVDRSYIHPLEVKLNETQY